jgi:Fe-S cluster assembly ATPase SufC
MRAGRIIHSGGVEVATTLEADGYDGVARLVAAAASV